MVLLHGFTQTGACLGPLAHDLATDRPVLTPDLAGHGDAADETEADPWAAADLVTASIDAEFGDVAVDVVGYSMGGRIALHLLVERPERIRRIVTIGATAGIEDDDERAARRARDHELADRVERIGIDEFLAEWLALSMFATLPDWARFEEERRSNTASGLAGSLRHAGTGSMTPLWDRLAADRGAGSVPLLALAGADDEPFAVLADRLAHTVSGPARSERIPAAGHAAHLERPDVVTALVRSHLDTA